MTKYLGTTRIQQHTPYRVSKCLISDISNIVQFPGIKRTHHREQASLFIVISLLLVGVCLGYNIRRTMYVVDPGQTGNNGVRVASIILPHTFARFRTRIFLPGGATSSYYQSSQQLAHSSLLYSLTLLYFPFGQRHQLQFLRPCPGAILKQDVGIEESLQDTFQTGIPKVDEFQSNSMYYYYGVLLASYSSQSQLASSSSNSRDRIGCNVFYVQSWYFIPVRTRFRMRIIKEEGMIVFH